MKTLKNNAEVILALGGITRTAELTGRSYHAAANWGTWSETFPPDTYLVMTTELTRRGYTAPPALWRQVEPKPEGRGRNGTAQATGRRERRAESRQ